MSYTELINSLRVYANDGTDELRNEAADAIETLVKDRVCRIVEHDGVTELSVVPRWIPVKDRLPEKRKYVLVRYKNNDMAVACWFDGDEDILFWRAMTDEGWCADCDTDPTHWMQLPMPPKEGTE